MAMMASRLPLLLWVLLLTGCLGFTQAQAENIKLDCRLIWGTEEPKKDDPKLKEVEASLSAKFRSIFKWKHYYEVGSQQVDASKDGQKLKMSPQCEIEIKHLEGNKIEVLLYGEGKLLVKKRQEIAKDEWVVIAGDDKDNTAWFLTLKRLN